MPGTKDGQVSKHWFEEQFGFVEGDPVEAKQQFSYEGGYLLCTAQPNKLYNVGSFEAVSLGTLSQQLEQALKTAPGGLWGAGALTFKNIVADTRSLINDKSNADAVFQVMSLLNCLESIPTGAGPGSGVTCYADAATQGSAAAIACPAATVFRNYFLHDPGKGEHSVDSLRAESDRLRQLLKERSLTLADVTEEKNGARGCDLLSEVEAFVDNATQGYWKVRNGFCLPRVKRNIANLSAAIANDDEFANDVRSKIQVGVFWHTDVSEGTHRVTQVFCSAPAVSMMKGGTRVQDWQVFARTVLEAMYDATLNVAAALALKRGTRVPCYLTLLGAGSLGCRREWIIDALERALLKHDRAPIDVRLVHYAALPHDIPALVRLEDGRGCDGNEDEVSTVTKEQLVEQRKIDQATLLRELDKASMSKVDALTVTFEAFDTNGDGVIDRREFVSMLQKVDKAFFTIGNIEKILAEADSDGDGVIHYIDFITWLCGEDEIILERMGELVPSRRA